PPTAEEISKLRPGLAIMGVYSPLSNFQLIKTLAEKNISVFSFDMIPRTTRAQSMDVLSSMSTISGYKAVLLAASSLPRFFPMLTTAAGTIAPARALVLGAGVAGLQAIATARRLGAVIEAFDTRPEVKEQVMSLGAKFVEVEGAKDASGAGGYAVEQTEEYKQRQAQAIHKSAAKADIIITTALIPGKRAPILIMEDTVREMKRGSVIVDLASAGGGNCQMTEPGKTVTAHGVTVIGHTNLPATMPQDASRMYGKNVINFLKNMIKGANWEINFSDDIVAGTCIAHGGAVKNAMVQNLLGS
ncbi:MAG TPA: NAD(P) transhydrogenase subunit alpha, partial [Leptospiraceae bacterium]|nr:NAD(P) transhydrogenase subunit alpha [Leptospiraceae bacterium]